MLNQFRALNIHSEENDALFQALVSLQAICSTFYVIESWNSVVRLSSEKQAAYADRHPRAQAKRQPCSYSSHSSAFNHVLLCLIQQEWLSVFVLEMHKKKQAPFECSYCSLPMPRNSHSLAHI